MKRKTMALYFSMPIIYIGLIFTLLLDVVVYRHLEIDEQQQTRELGTAYLAWLSQSVERYVNIADGMVSYVMREGGKPAKMEEQASQYFPMSPELRSIQLAPGGRVSQVYPWDKDRIDLQKIIANQSEWVTDAGRRRQRVSLTAMVERESGEKDIVFIRPIYLWNEGNHSTFWGFTIVDVSMDRMLEHLDLYRLGMVGFRYQLSWKNNDTGEDTVIAADGKLMGDTIQISRGIDGDLWTLEMQPVNGWGNAWMVILLTWVGLTVTMFMSFYRGRVNRIRRQGEIDPLTGAYNRKGGDRAVADYLQHEPGKVMVMTLDIDNFKLINDVYGHETGDLVLQQLVLDIRKTFGMPLIVTRNGGDEFVIVKGYKDEAKLIEKIQQFTENPHQVPYLDKKVSFHTSLGYALYPEQDTVYKHLCIKADFALYNAKLNGKNSWRKFDESLLDMQERFQLGFNLADMTNHMPGAMMVYRADDTRKILFASDQVINLFKCDNWEDFMEYSEGTVNRLICKEDREMMARERDMLIAMSQSDKDIEMIEVHVQDKKGQWKSAIMAGNYNVNAFHGGVFYVSLFLKSHLKEIKGG